MGAFPIYIIVLLLGLSEIIYVKHPKHLIINNLVIIYTISWNLNSQIIFNFYCTGWNALTTNIYIFHTLQNNNKTYFKKTLCSLIPE